MKEVVTTEDNIGIKIEACMETVKKVDTTEGNPGIKTEIRMAMMDTTGIRDIITDLKMNGWITVSLERRAFPNDPASLMNGTVATIVRLWTENIAFVSCFIAFEKKHVKITHIIHTGFHYTLKFSIRPCLTY